MMASLIIVIITLGCAAYQFFKGTFVRAFATIIIAICAGIAAFGFFEVLAGVLISRGSSGSFIAIAPWAQTLCFFLLFILVFALLQTGMMYLTNRPIDLGLLPERIGRAVCGIILGFIISGFLLTALEMAPLPAKYPYQRFDGKRHKVLLNADGFTTNLFSMLSNGSLSGKRSFSAIHPNYLDQLSLNRLISGISVLTSVTPAIKISRQAVWPAPENLTGQVNTIVSELNRQGKLKEESSNKSLFMPGPVSSNYQPTIVRVGINRSSLKPQAKISGGTFTLAQLRLICKQQGSNKDALSGTGINVYPIGHLKEEGQIQVSTEIRMRNSDFEGNAREKFIDFVFCVPRDFVPAMLAFKQNSLIAIPSNAIISADKAPSPEFYNQDSD